MYYCLIFGITFICYASANINRVQVPQKFLQNVLAKSRINKLPNKDGDIYIDKPDNKLFIPVDLEEQKIIKKPYKKHPKSTIQKIIARNRKNKKMMSNHLTTKPTLPPASDDIIDDFEDRDDDFTTQAALKRRKWNNKMPKYHSQIQKMPNRISPKSKRTKRDTDRDNTIIIQDFDEFEFLDHKKNYDIVKTHYKKYW